MDEQVELPIEQWIKERIKHMQDSRNELMHSRRPLWPKKRRKRIIEIAGSAGYIYAHRELLDAIKEAKARSTNEKLKSNAKKEAAVIPL